jgi:transcriptional regulator with XRE-family HTH domain
VSRKPLTRTVRCRADEIDRLRKARGLSLEELAAKAGVNMRTLQRWMAGHEAYIANVDAVATVLRVPPTAIIEGYDESLRALDNHAGDTRFVLRMTVSGTLLSADQARRLAEVPPSLIAELQRLGIHIDAADANVLVEDRTEERRRIVCLLYGARSTGEPCWIYAGVRPSMYVLFQQTIRNGDIVPYLYKFSVFGEIIVSGLGPYPPLEVTRKVYDLYSVPESADDAHQDNLRVYRNKARTDNGC